MRNPVGFDYNQPNRDSLVGVFVEAIDLDRDISTLELPANHEKSGVRLPVEQLFGITLSLLDDDTAVQHSRMPQE